LKSSPSTATHTISLFESLPPEIFNHVLSYLLNVDEVERTADTRLRGYAFDLSICQVNQHIYALSKTYFDKVNTWIRFDINLPALSPVKFDVPTYVAETGEDSLPPLSLRVRIRFPKALGGRWSTPDTTVNAFYILARDLDSFLRYERFFDFSICFRVQPGEDVAGRIAKKGQGASMAGIHGVSYKIEAQKGISAQKCRSLLERFRNLHGPLHDCVILGAPDVAHADSIVASIRDEPGNGQNPNVDEQALLMLRLKLLGDRHYTNGHSRSAMEVYRKARELREHHDARPILSSSTLLFSLATKLALSSAIRYNLALATIKRTQNRRDGYWRRSHMSMPTAPGNLQICQQLYSC
jgi:hypothetical protein